MGGVSVNDLQWKKTMRFSINSCAHAALALSFATIIGGLARPASGQCDPTILSSFDLAGVSNSVIIVDTVAYVAYGEGLAVFDAVDTLLYAYDVAISGTVAYVTDGYSGLRVIDVSNPGVMFILVTVDTPGFAHGVAISGTVAYVADGFSGLQVIDVSNSADPVILGTVDTPDQARGVAVSGNEAYVADGTSGLQVIDLLRCNIGACCVDGMCFDLMTEVNCLTMGGTYFGGGSTCDTSPACAPACPADITGDTNVNVTDLLLLLGAWGVCP